MVIMIVVVVVAVVVVVVLINGAGDFNDDVGDNDGEVADVYKLLPKNGTQISKPMKESNYR